MECKSGQRMLLILYVSSAFAGNLGCIKLLKK